MVLVTKKYKWESKITRTENKDESSAKEGNREIGNLHSENAVPKIEYAGEWMVVVDWKILQPQIKALAGIW